jgi:hypothetical protein
MVGRIFLPIFLEISNGTSKYDYCNFNSFAGGPAKVLRI